ncbi:MAG: CocE/NonD family hydrolase [Desulfotignum sp.]|nr:CocE/NonD family hydrolase [Desulfotignum sp.]
MQFQTLLEQSEPICFPPMDGVRRFRNLMIPMRDTVQLAADIYLPDNGAPDASFPVVMEYIPYRKDQVDLAARPFYGYLAGHGYLVIRVDIRGTGASAGKNLDEYVLQEQEDGYDCVEWIAAQPWCDGHVNMMGISYGGFSALQVATLQPPHLTSIIPVDFTDDRYHDDCHYKGGMIRQYYDIAYYGGAMVAANAMPSLLDISDGSWAQTWRQHLEENEPYLLQWYRHQTAGPYWEHGSVRYFADRIRCPIMMIGGWRDGYMNVPLRLFQAVSVPCKVWIGPWNHAMPDGAVPGPRVDYLKEVVRWLDHWCKDRPTGIMEEPPVVVFMQKPQPPVVDRLETRGSWRAETGWPVPGADTCVLFLGDNSMLAEDDSIDGHEQLAYVPTVGTSGGLFSGGIQFGLPGDQRPDEAFSAVHTTKALDHDLAVLGRPRAVLHVSSSAAVMGFVVSLCDVAPDGASHLVAKGALNGTRRNSFSDPEPMVPGTVYELEIDIDATGWIFEKGHRIRLSVANADWPNLWPTPEPGTSRIFWGKVRPSRLELPVVPDTGSAAAPRFAPSSMVRHPHLASPCPPVWEVCTDVLSGRTRVRLQVDAVSRLTETTVFEKKAHGEFQVHPRHPALASGQGKHLQQLKSDGGCITAESEVWVQGGKTHFQVIINLIVQVNGSTIFSRKWVESIERCLL